MLNQLLSTNHEISMKELEIKNMKSENDKLMNELKAKKEFVEKLNKPKETTRFMNEHMNASKRPHGTSKLGYVEFLSVAEKGESSKQGEQRNVNEMSKNNKPTCYHCGK